MRIIARTEKREAVRFISHLDMQRLFHRALRRADIPLSYSQGFNPHPILSFATALAVGYTSEAEWLDVRLDAEIPPERFIESVNRALPQGISIAEAFCVENSHPSLASMMAVAEYEIALPGEDGADVQTALEALLARPIMVEKRTKAGMKTVDIRGLVLRLTVETDAALAPRIRLFGVLNAMESLNIELFIASLAARLGHALERRVHRKRIYASGGETMPVWTGEMHRIE